MNSTVTEINIRQPNQKLITHIERLLADAKTGELVGMVDVAVWQGGTVSNGWYLKNGARLRTIIGELAFLKLGLMEEETRVNGSQLID